MTADQQTEIVNGLKGAFTLDELQQMVIAWDPGLASKIDWTASLHDAAVDLVGKCERRGRLCALMTRVAEERTHRTDLLALGKQICAAEDTHLQRAIRWVRDHASGPALPLYAVATALLGGLALSDGLSEAMQAQLVRASHARAPVEAAAVFAIPGQSAGERAAWRAELPALVRAMSAGDSKAAAIAIALDFAECREHDGALAVAIGEAEAAGVPVILGVRRIGGLLDPPCHEALDVPGRLGFTTPEGNGGAWSRVQVQSVHPERDEAIWHLAARAVHASQRCEAPIEVTPPDYTALRICERHASVQGGRLYSRPLEYVRWIELGAEPPTPGRFEGKIAIVGALDETSALEAHAEGMFGGTPVYEGQLVAAMVQALALGDTPRPLSGAESALTRGLSAAFAFLLALLLPPRLRWLGLGIALALGCVAAGVAATRGLVIAPMRCLFAAWFGVASAEGARWIHGALARRRS